MKIDLENAGKRFNREWIFRNCSLQFSTGHSYALTGPNGSGKSTMLQVIAGALMPSEGEITYAINGDTPVSPDHFHQYISMAAPYLDLVEEMTAREFLSFHRTFKPLVAGITIPEILEEVGLGKAPDKQIRLFSSGMKQRMKMAQAFFSNAPVLLLDEPCTNLDKQGYALYHRLVEKFAAQRIVIVASNEPEEYGFCEEVITVNARS